MQRRQFITLVGGTAATWPLRVRAQQSDRSARIGYLRLAPASQSQREESAFRDGLADLGYVEGKNLRIDYRSTEGDESQLAARLQELIELKVDVLVVHATGVLAALRATKTIPIVMAVGPDLVAIGAVSSLAHPGGNVTGSSFFLPEIMAKRLELLKEIAPSMTRAGVLLIRRADNANANVLDLMGATAKSLQVDLQPIDVGGPDEFDSAFAQWAKAKINGLVMADHTLLIYNTDRIAIFRRAAYFVDEILKGANPGDIPIEQATKFLSAVNLKTAKAFGIEVPTSILLRADEVIE